MQVYLYIFKHGLKEAKVINNFDKIFQCGLPPEMHLLYNV